MTKIILAAIIVIISVAFIGFPHSFSDPLANTTVSVKTDKTSYNIGDTIEISGYATNATSDKLVLKIFNSKTELVWLFQVDLGKNNTFETALPLSDSAWNESVFYVLTAKTGEAISATSFEINQTPTSQETTTSIVSKAFDKFLQNIFFLPIVGIFIIGITVYVLYSRRVQKNIASLKQEPLPLITFDAPSPAKVHLSRGTSMSYEGWNKIPEDQRPEINSVEFWITIKNIGGNTAENITALFLQKDEMFSRQDIENEKNADKRVLLPELDLGEFYYWNFEISWDRFVRLEKNNLFVGLLISYDKYETRNHSGIIFEIGKGGGYTMDEWFTH